MTKTVAETFVVAETFASDAPGAVQ